MKSKETVEAFLAAGGKITKCKAVRKNCPTKPHMKIAAGRVYGKVRATAMEARLVKALGLK